MTENIIKINGSGKNILEIQLSESGDFFVSVETHDVNLGRLYTRAQFPNPLNGGGDEVSYRKIKTV